MKDFIKFTLASIVGVVLACIIFTILSIVTVTGMILSSDTETTVKENSIFKLKMDGFLEERSDESPMNSLFGNKLQSLGLDEILSSIKKAKENDNIKGIYLETAQLSASFASLEEIRDALADFKESGKFIVAYSDMYSQGMYYLASVADKIIANPQATLEWQGLASQTVFYKDLLEKIGIEMQIFKVGTYKSAVEPFIATEMSEANREQVTVFLSSIWNTLLKDISSSRNISVEKLNSYADEMLTMQPAEKYVDYGMVDTLMYKDGVLDYLKELTDRKEDESLRTLSLEDMTNVKSNVPLDKSGNIIAVYYAYGGIDDNTSTEGIVSEKVIRDLRKIREDENVKALVLRVNSPGGSAYGSEQIWREVVKMKEAKPVIVSMGDYAASGGYYISCAADCIVADPTTLTGSIGIFGMVPNTEGLMTGKLGLHYDIVKTNKLADFGSINRRFNAEESAIMQQHINSGYELFVKRCAEGRGMTTEAIKKIAEGRVWTGETAKELGLVDELGGLEKALEIAKEKAGVENYSLISYPDKDDFFNILMDTNVEDYFEGKMQDSFGEYYGYMKFIKNLKEADRIQARMPFDLQIR